MRITYEELLKNPQLLERLREEAHRQRAQALHELVFQPIRKFFSDRGLVRRGHRITECSGLTC